MAAERFTMQGLAGVLDALGQLPPELVGRNGGPVLRALQRSAEVIRAEARVNLSRIVSQPNERRTPGGGPAPNRSTGLMEKSIQRRRVRMERGKGERIEIGFPNRVRYDPAIAGQKYRRVRDVAWMLEFGTANRAPHPFMRPAFATKGREASAMFETEIQRQIALITKKLARQNKVS
jgi:hypothetical protein